jgi:hypothetical protein
MKSHEAFYVNVQGEQKGPYTLRHLDHLLNSGLIPVDTTYWTEGMENWQPLTDLVQLRDHPRSWKRLFIVGGILMVLGGFLAFFGPTIADGWREGSQRNFTAEGAYWSARGAVRTSDVVAGGVVHFAPFKDARITLTQPAGATVLLRGEVIGGAMSSKAPTTWSVKLSFNSLRADWSANEVQVVPE